MREEADHIEKDKAKLLETKQSLCKSGEGLPWKEVVARTDLEAADELLNDAKTKLDDTARTKRVEDMQRLGKIRDKQWSLDSKTDSYIAGKVYYFIK